VSAGKAFEEKREHERDETVAPDGGLANDKWGTGGQTRRPC
jgi:hypothetical protein